MKTLSRSTASRPTAFEIKSTRALATDSYLLSVHGPLELINSGEEVGVRLSRKDRLVLKPDGLVVCTGSPIVFFNSAKQAHAIGAAHR